MTSSTLTAEQIGQLRDELLRTLQRLERNTRVNGNGHSREIDQSAVGRLSRIEAIQNQGLTRDLADRERMQMEAVLDALRRLDSGTYGLCTSCHQPIRFERLVVFPEVRTCTQCSAGN